MTKGDLRISYKDMKIFFFIYQKMPDEEEDEEEEESLDATVVDTEEVNVQDKLKWDYACFTHRFMHLK